MKQYGNNDYEFKGYDWTELAEYFGADVSDEESSKAIDEKLTTIIREMHDDSLKTHPDAVKIREYIIKLEKCDNTYKKPLWKGLLNIKADSVFLKFVSLLYCEMWN